MELERTPIYEIFDRKQSGNQLYIMREDLLPFSLGGNKVRIANAFFEDMQKKGCDIMIAYGNVRSNLCRVIANECFRKKIPCYMICSFEEGESEEKETSNSHLMQMLKVKIVKCRKNQIAKTVEATMNRIIQEGHKPYYIYGNKFGTGNEGVSASAYAKAYQEILNFEKNQGIFFDYIFHASGTGATQAGLTCGHLLARDKKQIVGILISSREYERAVSIIETGIREYLKGLGKEFSMEDQKEIHLASEYTKGGYGQYDEEIEQCIREEFALNGVAMDGTYTGKAFLGMEHYIEEHQISGKKILFIHTGGTPLFYDWLGTQKKDLGRL